MNDINFQYVSLKEDELSSMWSKHKKLIEGFTLSNNYDLDKIGINENAVLSVIVKVDQRQKYFKFFHKLDMSEYKEAALNSFWYIKLRPLSFKSKDLTENESLEYESLNEKLGVYIILTTLRAMLKKSNKPTKKLDEIPLKYIEELIYTLTYRDISKEALIILVESIAVFLGLDPYATNRN